LPQNNPSLPTSAIGTAANGIAAVMTHLVPQTTGTCSSLSSRLFVALSKIKTRNSKPHRIKNTHPVIFTHPRLSETRQMREIRLWAEGLSIGS
jgi:hypothetical protein